MSGEDIWKCVENRKLVNIKSQHNIVVRLWGQTLEDQGSNPQSAKEPGGLPHGSNPL